MSEMGLLKSKFNKMTCLSRLFFENIIFFFNEQHYRYWLAQRAAIQGGLFF